MSDVEVMDQTLEGDLLMDEEEDEEEQSNLEETISRAVAPALRNRLKEYRTYRFEIEKHVHEAMDFVYTSASALQEFGDQQALSELEKTTKEFAIVKAQLNAFQSQLSKIEAAMQQGAVDTAKIEQMLHQAEKRPRVVYKRDDFYKKFCDRAGIENGEEDEDVIFQESESTVSTICPITQLEMEEPMRNPACGHTYSKKGIEAHVRRNKKCPVAGCRKEVKLSDLERDVRMEVVLERKQQAATQASHLDLEEAANAEDTEDEEVAQDIDDEDEDAYVVT